MGGGVRSGGRSVHFEILDTNLDKTPPSTPPAATSYTEREAEEDDEDEEEYEDYVDKKDEEDTDDNNDHCIIVIDHQRDEYIDSFGNLQLGEETVIPDEDIREENEA